MAEEKPSGLDVLMKAYRESNGEYINLSVEHGELPGLRPELMAWWGEHMDNPEFYKMWHPEDHFTHDIETITDKDGNTVTMMYAEERVSPYAASILRLRQEDPESSPVSPRTYKPFASSTMLGPDDEVIGGIYHEAEVTPAGMKIHSTFRFPAKTPREFLDAMARHSKTEMGNFPKFLPDLYARETGKK